MNLLTIKLEDRESAIPAGRLWQKTTDGEPVYHRPDGMPAMITNAVFTTRMWYLFGDRIAWRYDYFTRRAYAEYNYTRGREPAEHWDVVYTRRKACHDLLKRVSRETKKSAEPTAKYFLMEKP